MITYSVKMIRFSRKHQYELGVYDNFDEACAKAEIEVSDRGGKYGYELSVVEDDEIVNIIKVEGDYDRI